MGPENSRPHFLYIAAVLLIFAFGIFLRLPFHLFGGSAPLAQILRPIHPQPMYTEVGFDEGLYRTYVNGLTESGLTNYPSIVDHYIEVQRTLPGSILPPIRFLYIFTSYLWKSVFGSEALMALRNVAACFSILTLLLSTMFAWRVKGPPTALGVSALMSCAPTQIHMSQHALVDGFFTFWALLCLWLLWENLKAPKHLVWLIAYVAALFCLVLTKENSFFVWVALIVILLCNRWFQFGLVNRELVMATVLGPLLGVVALIFLAGGIDNLATTYQLSVSKNYQLTYAILTGDGPWHRYLIDLLLVSPIVFLLALGTIFRLDRIQKPEIFVALFIVVSYLIMCNLKYGMNLRYANMWDMPLRLLAFTQIAALATLIKSQRFLLTSIAVVLICAVELRQYIILFVQHPLYELVPEGLLRALNILKSP